MLSPGRSDGHDEASPSLIRPAVASDEAFIVELANQAFRFYGTYGNFVSEWFRDASVTTRIADEAGTPVGFWMLTSYPDPDRPSDRIADLVAIAVAPDKQSRGVGQRLLSAALGYADDGSHREIWLVVADGNARAQRFFARNGFRLGAGVGVYPGGQTARRMLKTLSTPSETQEEK